MNGGNKLGAAACSSDESLTPRPCVHYIYDDDDDVI